MTDLDKLKIVNEALLHEISRIKIDDYLLKNDLNKAGERVSALLEVERNLSSKIQELQKKNDQLEADLTFLHETLDETLEKIESELAKVKSENEELSFRNKNQTDIITTLQSQNSFLMNFVPEECDCKMNGECRLCPKYTGEKQ
jgi:chromosome segregation ATPase